MLYERFFMAKMATASTTSNYKFMPVVVIFRWIYGGLQM